MDKAVSAEVIQINRVTTTINRIGIVKDVVDNIKQSFANKIGGYRTATTGSSCGTDCVMQYSGGSVDGVCFTPEPRSTES
ncbi:MAG: hypothetical protein UZ06_CHB003001477 [Chlorobi bacterium OLB6]|nr:MAG: hypothetical protein UZ06_CHB003001477 [Chlorobi bacterium OLB6]